MSSRALILAYPGGACEARHAWIDGEAMLSRGHGDISRHTAGELAPASILIQCQAGRIVTFPWPMEERPKRRSRFWPTLAWLALLGALGAGLWVIS